MTITARYPGTCRKCGGRIEPGQEVEWDKDTRRTTHIGCLGTKRQAHAAAAAPPPPLASKPGGVQIPSGRNRRAGSCERCGAWLPQGQGILSYCEYDTGCPKHRDESGYHLYCADGGCQRRRNNAKAAAEANRKAAVEAALAGLRALTEPIALNYHDGEYLSGHTVHRPAAEYLETLGLCRYISMWGYYVEPRLIKTIGTEFSGEQAAAFAASLGK